MDLFTPEEGKEFCEGRFGGPSGVVVAHQQTSGTASLFAFKDREVR
jgi:hypothetical protein